MDKNIKYCVVDIETTGGNGRFHKITEIAAILTDGKEILDTFHSLINPERLIPAYITKLTGINNHLVDGAPKFYEIAKEFIKFSEGSVFVAHNVFFDYNFIKSEYAELGYQFSRSKLCTVKLTRKVIPGHSSYSLGNITKDLGIILENHHRAMDDAKASFELLRLCLERDPQTTNDHLQKNSKKMVLPAQVSQEMIDNLPEQMGIYFLRGENNENLYIGKSVNIKKRIRQHFRPDMKRKKDIELKSKVYHIDTICTGNALAMDILECDFIKKESPPYNVRLKKKRYLYSVTIGESKEFHELKISTYKEEDSQAPRFSNRKHAANAIALFHNLTFGLQGPDYDHELKKWKNTLGSQSYNEKLKTFFHHYIYPYDQFEIKLNGRIQKEKCHFSFDHHTLKEIRYRVNEENSTSFSIDEGPDHKSIVLKYLRNNSKTVINSYKSEIQDFL